MAKTLTLILPADQMARLASLLSEAAAQAGDDGNEGCPDEMLLDRAAKAAREAK